MGTADFHHVPEPFHLGLEGVAQPADRGEQHVFELLDRGDVHGGRKRVVGTLAAVHVVVGMDRRLGTHPAAGEFDRTVGDDFVGVHVRLRAGAGLEHHQRKMVVERAGNHLVRGAHDQVHLVRGELVEFAVRLRGPFLEYAEGTDDRAREAEPFHPDRKIVARTLGLRTPIPVGRDADLSHAVFFYARFVGCRTHALSSCGVSPGDLRPAAYHA